MTTEELSFSAGETIEYAKLYVEQRTDYLKLESAKQIAKTSSNLITLMAIAAMGFIVLVLLSITIALWLGELLGSYPMAFLIMTVFFAVVTLLIYLFKKPLITNPILAMTIKNMFD